MSDPGMTVLSAILPGRADLLETAVRKLRPAHFGGVVLPQLFAFMQRYLDMTGEVATEGALRQMLESQRAQAGTIALWCETFGQLQDTTVSDGEFAWAVEQLREQAATQATGEALATGYQILTQGMDGKDGRIVGPDAARQHILEKFAAIDAELNQAEAPEGDIRAEQEQIIGRYLKVAEHRRRGGGRPGIGTGVDAIDDRLGGGLSSGELALFAGFSSSGKTSLCVSTVWNAVTSGKNVVMFTSETLRHQVINKLIARHSRHPQYQMELPDGIDSARIRAGSLSGPEISAYSEVLRDFTANPAYGKCYIAQVPWGATIGTVGSRLSRIGHLFEVHLCVIDYLQLLHADRRRDAQHEETAQMVKDAKALAATFGGGTGVPVISPWQVNRPGRDRALKEGSYSGIDLAGSAEAFNAQPLRSRVRMADGSWREIGNLQKGDRVIDPDGQDSKVLGVYRKGERSVYRVTLADGTYAEACDQHLWVAESLGTWTGRRIMSTLELKKAASGDRGVRLTAVSPMSFDGSVLPLDPYVLGVLISEGSLGETTSSQVSFTQDCRNTDLLERVRAALPPGHVLRSREKTGKHIISGDGSRRQGSNQVLTVLRELGLSGKRSWEKFIPEIYMRAGTADRHALLQGIMDGDGCIQRRKNGCLNVSFTSASERLRDDVAELVRTLGGRCHVRRVRGIMYTSPAQKMPKAARDSYRITSLQIPLVPFYMARKAALFSVTSASRKLKVASVEYVGEEAVACIRVSADSQMYVTDGDLPTHNTPDVVLTLLEPPKIENPRAAVVKGELLKNRDGPRGAVIPLKIDYATSWFRCEDDGMAAPAEVMMGNATSIESLMGG